MGLDTGSQNVAATWDHIGDPRLRMRWVCVLQRGGVEDRESLARYLDWAVTTGVVELCFKELHVSTSIESEYHDHAANLWSAAHQVPLALLVEFAAAQGWPVEATLPRTAEILHVHRGTRSCTSFIHFDLGHLRRRASSIRGGRR